MTAAAGADPPEPPATSRPGAERPQLWRDIGLAIAILLAGMGFGIVGTLVFQLVGGLLGWSGDAANATGSLFGGAVWQLTIITMLVARARRRAGGQPAALLAAGPVQRCGTLIAIFLWLLFLHGRELVPVLVSPAFRAQEVRVAALHDIVGLYPAVQGGAVAIGIWLVTLVIITPIWEELMFRGWLWTALRRTGGSWPAVLLTTAAWLALHIPNGGLPRIVQLMPLTALLTLARLRCGSVRATIAVHGVNNALVILTVLLAILTA